MDLLNQLGYFSARKKKEVIYRIIFVIAIIIAIIWFSRLFPFSSNWLSTADENNLVNGYNYQDIAYYLEIVDKFYQQDIPFIKKVENINYSANFSLPKNKGRSNPFLPQSGSTSTKEKENK